MEYLGYIGSRLAAVAVLAIVAALLCNRFRRRPDKGPGVSPEVDRGIALDDDIHNQDAMANNGELQQLKDAARGGFYRIRRYDYEDPRDKGRYYFELCAGGIKKEPVAISERYTSKSGARRGIESVRRWALNEAVIEELDTLTGRHGEQLPRR